MTLERTLRYSLQSRDPIGLPLLLWITKRLVALLLVFISIPLIHAEDALGTKIVLAAREQIGLTKHYDPSYEVLKYPGGDVPLRTGVCTDVIVRALRGVGIDLQKEVHEDMLKSFSVYPKKWGLKSPDKNIDHRRVANLMRYFERHQIAMHEKLEAREAYRPGDIVAWDLGKGVLHIGIVSDKVTRRAPLIIHNIGSGAKEEDILFRHRVIGHFRVKEKTGPNGPPNSSQPNPPATNGTPPAAGSGR